MTKHGDALALIEQAVLCPTDDCMLWPYLQKKGYAYVDRADGKHLRVTRIVCTRVHGEPPTEKHEAAHSCGNNSCINPRHLRWATHKENIADKRLHGTHQAGELHPRARLTADDVRAIRQAYADGATQVALAAKYGVRQTHISNIVLRISWKSV